MNVTNCKGCGRLFNQMGSGKLCPQCVSQLEDKFQEVKKYLNERPNSSIEAVAQDNDVSVKQIKQWVREERLTFSEGSVSGIECESCGTMILTGRFCDSCRFRISSNLMSALDKPKAPEPRRDNNREKDRMRFLQN